MEEKGFETGNGSVKMKVCLRTQNVTSEGNLFFWLELFAKGSDECYAHPPYLYSSWQMSAS